MPKKKTSLTIQQPSSKKKLHIICRNIRYYREKQGMEQKELGAKIGVIGNTVCNWENGYSRPDLNHIPNICKALNITLYELFDLEDPMLICTEKEQELISNYRTLSKKNKYILENLIDTLKAADNIDNIPEIKMLVLYDRSLAAGIGDPTEFNETGEPIYLYTNEYVKRANCVFRVNGNSMEPKYSNGDLVLVQKAPECSDLKPGDVGAFIVGNETYIKQYHNDGLHSFNPDYPDMHFDSETNVFFIGKVLGIVDQNNDIANDQDIDRYLSLHEE